MKRSRSSLLTILVESLANPHCHLRDIPEVMKELIRLAIAGGVDIIGPMPNTTRPLVKAEHVILYIKLLKSLVRKGEYVHFLPIAMITEDTTVVDIFECVIAGIVDFKVYPRFRTTNAEHGVVEYHKIIALVRIAADFVKVKTGKVIKVHLHPEHPSKEFDNRDAEYCFLPIAYMLVQSTSAIIIWEHGTDSRCIPHWKMLAKSGRFYVTITAHHLATDEDETFGDVRAKCKPPIKLKRDKEALIALVAEDHLWVMAGPDDAPHPIEKKHVHQGECACGAYTSPFLLLLYAQALLSIFPTIKGRRTFINFTSRNARKLHGLPPAKRKIRLVVKQFDIPLVYEVGPWKVEPFWAGRKLDWSFAD